MANPYKYRVRCIEAHTYEIPASALVDHNGNVLCQVPASSFFYPTGHESGFRTRKDRDAYLKARGSKWEAVP